MAVSVEYKNLDNVATFIRDLPNSSFPILKEEVQRTLFKADARVKTKTELQRRSGSLFQSLRTSTEGTNIQSFNAHFYTDKIYSKIQEEGGPVTPKRAYTRVPGGPYLNIPAKANLTPAGVMRKSAKQVFNEGGRIVEIRPFKYGVYLKGRKMFHLSKGVKIKPRFRMYKSTVELVPEMLQAITRRIGEE